GGVLLQRNRDVTFEIGSFDPQVSVIGETGAYRHISLINPAALSVIGSHFHFERVISDLSLLCGRIEHRLTPEKADGIIIAIVGIAFPIARQARGIGALIEAAVADEFGIESAFY